MGWNAQRAAVSCLFGRGLPSKYGGAEVTSFRWVHVSYFAVLGMGRWVVQIFRAA